MSSIRKKISQWLNPSGPRKAPEYAMYLTVQCSKCQEIIRARVDLRNDLTINYDNDNTYYCRKVIIGENRCYQPIEVELTFDSKKKIVNQKISGGEILNIE